MAFLAQTKGWGLLNMLPLPAWFALPVAVLLLDLTIYGQHVAFHATPLLWRLHRMHHADLEFDVTTGLRFHPGEIVLSMIVKLAAVLVLGAPPRQTHRTRATPPSPLGSAPPRALAQLWPSPRGRARAAQPLT